MFPTVISLWSVSASVINLLSQFVIIYIFLYINISTYITTGNREGFEHWAKLNNLKEAAKTFNYLSENNLLNYEDFQQHISDVENSIKATEHRIEEIGNEINTQKVIQKHCDSYRLCRKVIEAGKSAPNQKDYRSRHQAEYQLHDSLKKELQDLGVTKIQALRKFRRKSRIWKLNMSPLLKKNRNCRRSKKTLNIIQQNFTSLLDFSHLASHDHTPTLQVRCVASYLQHFQLSCTYFFFEFAIVAISPTPFKTIVGRYA